MKELKQCAGMTRLYFNLVLPYYISVCVCEIRSFKHTQTIRNSPCISMSCVDVLIMADGIFI